MSEEQTAYDLTETQPTTSISTEIAEYQPIIQALSVLQHKYSNVAFEVATYKGMQEALKARAELRGYRVSMDKARKELKRRTKQEIAERLEKIETVAVTVIEQISALEQPLDEQIKAEEARKEAERQRKAEEEQRRVSAIHVHIDEIRNRGIADPSWNADAILKASELVTQLELDPTTFQEFLPLATEVRTSAYGALLVSYHAKLAQEQEQARIEAERAELDRLRKEAEEREAEIKRMKAAEEARIAFERAEEEKRIKASREEEERKNAAIRAAEQARIEEERKAEAARKAEEAKRIAAERAEHEAKMKAEREAQEAETKKQAEEAAKIKAEQDKIAAEKFAIEEEKLRQKLEAKRLKEHKARLAAEKVESPAKALGKILALAEDYENHPDHEWVRRDIAIIAAANIPEAEET